jgi:hypothetical protein
LTKGDISLVWALLQQPSGHRSVATRKTNMAARTL